MPRRQTGYQFLKSFIFFFYFFFILPLLVEVACGFVRFCYKKKKDKPSSAHERPDK